MPSVSDSSPLYAPPRGGSVFCRTVLHWGLLPLMVVITLAASGWVFHLGWEPTDSLARKYRRVELGMDRAEVLLILGQTWKPESGTGGMLLSSFHPVAQETMPDPSRRRAGLVWKQPDEVMMVMFNPRGQAVYKKLWRHPTPMDRTRKWLGL